MTRVMLAMSALAVAFVATDAVAGPRPGAPGAPTFSDVTTESVVVSWTAGSGATSHRLQRAKDSGFTQELVTIASATSPCADAGLTPSTTYWYRAVAVNKSGTTTGPSASVTTAALPTATIRFANDAFPTGLFASQTTFSINATPRINVAVDVANVTGSHTLRIDYIAAIGTLYYAKTIAFATDNTAVPPEVQATIEPDGYRVWHTLEVQGTPIETYLQTGTWTVRVTLDPVGQPPLAEATFELLP